MKRSILPTAYSSKKLKNAFLWNKQSLLHQDAEDRHNDVAENDGIEIDESKAKIQEEIRGKIAAMDGLDCIEIDASDSEVEDIQSIMEYNSNEDNTYDTDPLFVAIETDSLPTNTLQSAQAGNGLLHQENNSNQEREFKIVHMPWENFEQRKKENVSAIDKLLLEIRKHVPDKYSCNYVRYIIFLELIDFFELILIILLFCLS